MKLNSILDIFKKSKPKNLDTTVNTVYKKDIPESPITNAILEAGMKKALSKDFQGALKDFNIVIEIEPLSVDAANAYLERVKIKLELKDVATIDEDMDAAKVILDRMDEAWDAYTVGGEDYDNGNYKSAIKNYNNAISLRPTLTDVYYNRGIAKQLLKDFKGAIEDFDKTIETNASNIIDAYVERGHIKYHELKDKEGAIQDYNKAIEINPNDANLFYRRASLLDEFDAIQDLNKAIELNPSVAKNYWARGIRKHKNKDYEGGQKDILKYINLAPSDAVVSIAEAYSLMGSMKIGMNDFKGALQDLNEAIKLDSLHIETLLDRGITKSFLKDYEGAIVDFNKVLELEPTEADAYYNRGLTKNSLGRKEEGNIDIAKAKKLGYDVPNDDYDEEEAKAFAEAHFKKIVEEVKEKKKL